MNFPTKPLAFCVLFLSTTCHSLNGTELAPSLNELLDQDPTARRTTVALKVVDLETGEVLFDRFGDRLFTPASNLKIYTSACALDLFGPQHRFITRVTASVDAQSGTARDMQLLGGGDSMLSSEELGKLADRVVNEWSVRTVEGPISVDNSRYSHEQLGPGWMWDDQPYYFNMRVTPLMLDFNVETIPADPPEGEESEEKPERKAVQNPAAWISETFASMLLEREVITSSTTNNGTPHWVRREITLPGPTLEATLTHFNHVSENAVGEVLLHEIALANGGTNRPNWKAGAKTITNWLTKTAGLEDGSFRLVDGSGLSRYNLISADSSIRLLAFMRKHKHYQAFFNSLFAYELDTPEGKKKGFVRAKSGGMSGVSTISGYVQTLDGRELAFSLLANGLIGSAEPVFELRQKVWNALIRYQPTPK